MDLAEEYTNLGMDRGMKVWGKELTIDARCDAVKVNDPEVLRAFLKEVVVRINMKAYKEPQIELFGEGGLYGYSALQWIHTSNIVLHTCLDGQCYLNIFSCKTFDQDVVRECFVEFFGGEIDFCEFTYRGVQKQ
jgi:S-adenosylmethionine/arginine decarboxylase-like enzyme